jgi:hypothetical protein
MVPMPFIFYAVASENFNVNHQPTPHRYDSHFDGDILFSSSLHPSAEREKGWIQLSESPSHKLSKITFLTSLPQWVHLEIRQSSPCCFPELSAFYLLFPFSVAQYCR